MHRHPHSAVKKSKTISNCSSPFGLGVGQLSWWLQQVFLSLFWKNADSLCVTKIRGRNRKDAEGDSHHCPKFGITFHSLPSVQQSPFDMPQHFLSCGHQYTSHSSFFHSAISFFQATTVLSTEKCWTFKCPPKQMWLKAAHLQQCHKDLGL